MGLDCTASCGAEKMSRSNSLWNLHLRTERVLMKPHDWRFAGGVVNRDDIEPAGALGDAALCQKVLRGTSQQVLFAGRDA